MKLILYDESNMILFLNHLSIPKIDFEDKDELEDYFRELFLKLHEKYNLEISGYYQIDIYLDSYYGAIIEIEKEVLEYYVYDDNQIDMRICVHQTPVLYELEEYIPFHQKYYDTIYYQDKWYIKLKGKINDIDLGRLLEYATIHYGEDTNQIIKNGIYF